MSNLNAFLRPALPEKVEEVVVSQRFTDENGVPQPFQIRALTQEENEEVTKKATRTQKVDGVMQERLDSIDFTRRLVVAATVFPDFKSTEVCEYFGTLDPLQVPGKMLLAGEYAKLAKAISKLCGFEESVEEEAKN